MKLKGIIFVLTLITICVFLLANLKVSNADTGLGRSSFEKPISEEIRPQIEGVEIKSEEGLGWLANMIVEALSWLVEGITKLITGIINLLNKLFAIAADYLHELNPFQEDKNSPIQLLWNILKGFAYIIFSFSILAAGFMWILENESAALGLIFNLIIVALLINFTYTLIKEAFLVVYTLEKGLTKSSITSEQKSVGIGSLIYASLWQKDPVSSIQKTVREFKFQSFWLKIGTTVITNVFLVIFAMATFVMLVLLSALLLARYILLIFFTAVSPIAIVSLALPRFQKAPIGRILSQFNIFEPWLEKLVNWLIIVLIFVLLAILGNTLKDSTFGQIKIEAGDLGDAVEFIMVFALILGWYVVDIYIAVNLSGVIGKTAVGFAFGTLMTTGALAAKGLRGATGRVAGYRAGAFLKWTGGLIERLPVNFATAGLINWAAKLKEKGEIMQRGVMEPEAVAAQFKTASNIERLRELRRQLEQAKTPAEREKIENQIKGLISSMGNIIQKYSNNPYILEKVIGEFEKSPQFVFEEIFKNRDLAEKFISPNLPPEAQKIIADKIRNLSKDVTENFLQREWLDIFKNAGRETQRGLVDAVEKLDEDTAISKLKDVELKVEDLEHPIIKAINKKTKGLIEAAVKGELEKVQTALAKLDISVWENIENIQDLLNKYMPGEVNKAIWGAFTKNPSNVLKGTLRGNEDNIAKLRGILGNFQDVISQVSLTEEEKIMLARVFGIPLVQPSAGEGEERKEEGIIPSRESRTLSDKEIEERRKLREEIGRQWPTQKPSTEKPENKQT